MLFPPWLTVDALPPYLSATMDIPSSTEERDYHNLHDIMNSAPSDLPERTWGDPNAEWWIAYGYAVRPI